MLDLKQPLAQEAARRLIATVDVLIENFRPGVMAKFGLDLCVGSTLAARAGLLFHLGVRPERLPPRLAGD